MNQDQQQNNQRQSGTNVSNGSQESQGTNGTERKGIKREKGSQNTNEKKLSMWIGPIIIGALAGAGVAAAAVALRQKQMQRITFENGQNKKGQNTTKKTAAEQKLGYDWPAIAADPRLCDTMCTLYKYERLSPDQYRLAGQAFELLAALCRAAYDPNERPERHWCVKAYQYHEAVRKAIDDCKEEVERALLAERRNNNNGNHRPRVPAPDAPARTPGERWRQARRRLRGLDYSGEETGEFYGGDTRFSTGSDNMFEDLSLMEFRSCCAKIKEIAQVYYHNTDAHLTYDRADMSVQPITASAAAAAAAAASASSAASGAASAATASSNSSNSSAVSKNKDYVDVETLRDPPPYRPPPPSQSGEEQGKGKDDKSKWGPLKQRLNSLLESDNMLTLISGARAVRGFSANGQGLGDGFVNMAMGGFLSAAENTGNSIRGPG